MSKKIWVNTIVKNEENFIYYSLMSVVDFVDKILIWDTGSNDKTLEIIKEVKKYAKDKIEYKAIGEVDKFQFSLMRQKMLVQSRCDWIIILDGDEIWWKDSIRQLINLINKDGDKLDGIVVPFYNLIGDIYHYQPENAGRYQILGKKGHHQVKAINLKIPGLHVNNPHPDEGYFNQTGEPIQKSEKLVFLNAYYLHVSHLLRSSKNRGFNKTKYEIGKKFPQNFKFPEVFGLNPPSFIPRPWKKMSATYFVRAAVETLPKKIKRSLI